MLVFLSEHEVWTVGLAIATAIAFFAAVLLIRR